MKIEHTKNALDDVLKAVAEVAGSDTAALVLNHLELSRYAAEKLMEHEVSELAGDRYSHDKPHAGRYRRWGSNPGSIQVGGQRLRVRVPRVEDVETGRTQSPEIYGRFRKLEEPPPHVIEAIFRGLGTRNLDDVTERLMDSYGLSKSRWSDLFVRHSGEILEGFLNRRLDDATYVALFIDGKVIQGQSLLVAIGVTARGEKRTLGLAQASTENAGAITVMLREMIERGLGFDDGILIVIDGSKGMRKAIDDVFGDHAVIQRCQLHKMRNVLDYLSESERPTWKKLLQDLYACEDYQEARGKATALIASLKSVNVSAARSLEEGLEETLTICRLKLVQHFKRAFSTTNIIESANSVIARKTRHITRWTTADQRLRWSALALLDFEESCNRIHNFSRLPMLQKIITNEIQQRLHQHHHPSKASRFSTKKRT